MVDLVKKHYVVEGSEEDIARIDFLMKSINWCCAIGTGAEFKIFCDGDGNQCVAIYDENGNRLEDIEEEKDGDISIPECCGKPVAERERFGSFFVLIG